MNENNIQQGERLSFFKLFSEKHYRVCIPIIQRDYAQGRRTSKEVRDNFLTALYDYLDEEKPNRDLDFVYGTITENDGVKEFVPLDGQQRLTTLFLLHWYLSLISDDSEAVEAFRSALLKDGRSMFTYRTRSSSSEFCDALMSHPIDIKCLKESDIDEKTGEPLHNEMSKTIMNSSWFYLSWRHDPTVQSMLTMLDSINLKFAGKKEFFPLLLDPKEPVITFLFLDLNIFKLSDDLYIKMNSRGKPLTAFENFKAKYEQSLDIFTDKVIKDYHLPKREFFLTFHGKEQKVSLKRYFSHNVDTKWANLLWNYRDLQNREGAKNDFTFDDELMNLIRVVFTNRYAVVNDVPPKAKVPTLEYLRGSEIAKKEDPDYSDVISYHKYKEFGIAFDKDDMDRLDKKPGDDMYKKQYSIEAAYGYALALVDTLDCFWNGSKPIRTYLPDDYRFYYDEEKVFKRALSLDFEMNQERVLFHAYTRFLIYHQGNTAGLDEWMRVISNLSHPENTIIDEAGDLSAALKSVEKLLEHSDHILKYLTKDPDIDKFSSWQVTEEKIKAHLILRSHRWEELIEKVEKHGYFNGQIGFLLNFSGIFDYYMQDKRHNCNWSDEEDEHYFNTFKDYSDKASGVFMKDYANRVNDKGYVFERAVFTKGNYLEYSDFWRRNLLSTNMVKNNVKRDHSWKRFLRLSEAEDVRAHQSYVKAVFDDPRFDKNNVHDSLLSICKDSTGTWRDFFIVEPALFDYCTQGFVHYINDDQIILLSQSQYNHYHAELHTYFLWMSTLVHKAGNYSNFQDIRYYEVKSSEEGPCIQFAEYVHDRIRYEMDIYYVFTENEDKWQYELCFFKMSRSNAHFEDYKEDIIELLEKAGFSWYDDYEYFHMYFDTPKELIDKMNQFYESLPFELSE